MTSCQTPDIHKVDIPATVAYITKSKNPSNTITYLSPTKSIHSTPTEFWPPIKQFVCYKCYIFTTLPRSWPSHHSLFRHTSLVDWWFHLGVVFFFPPRNWISKYSWPAPTWQKHDGNLQGMVREGKSNKQTYQMISSVSQAVWASIHKADYDVWVILFKMEKQAWKCL